MDRFGSQVDLASFPGLRITIRSGFEVHRFRDCSRSEVLEEVAQRYRLDTRISSEG